VPTPEETQKAAVSDASVYLEKDVKGAYDEAAEWDLGDGTKVKPAEIEDKFGRAK